MGKLQSDANQQRVKVELELFRLKGKVATAGIFDKDRKTAANNELLLVKKIGFNLES